MRKYHLSYDVKDCRKDFNSNYAEAKRFLLCVIGNTNPTRVCSYNASSLILEYDKTQPNLFVYLTTNLSPYFNFSISLIAADTEGTYHFIKNVPDNGLNNNLQNELANLDCGNLGKTITAY